MALEIEAMNQRLKISQEELEYLIAKSKISFVPQYEMKSILTTIEEQRLNVEQKQRVLNSTSHEIQQMSFESGSSFGELAMQSEKAVRGGTCTSDGESFCAIVDRNSYVKIIKKLNQETVTRITKFLR